MGEDISRSKTTGCGAIGPQMKVLYLGIAEVQDGEAKVALAFHDSVFIADSLVKTVELPAGDGKEANAGKVADLIISEVEKYEHRNTAKVIGAGLSTNLRDNVPALCSRLWLELDIVPVIVDAEQINDAKCFWGTNSVDEQADSTARTCAMHFGPTSVPFLQVGARGAISHGRINLVRLEDYRSTCSSEAWTELQRLVEHFKQKRRKMAFFSATPQGGGVAIMRHSLLRLANLLGLEFTWYVPKPRPSVFQTTKMLHNILQGANEDGDSIGEKDYQAITEWISDNADRYWFSDKGPLCSPERGGVDIVVVDDPQMAELVAMSKDVAPNRPVFYRSHIQIRSDLVSRENSPQAQAWNVLWKRIKGCDKFLSHPVDSFVPGDVPKEKIVYYPGTSDLLDGLNKSLNDWDWKYYGHLYNVQCLDKHQTQLDWENRPYIIQISRFDPSKAIDTVINSYGEFRRRCTEAGMETSQTPQLVICGNGSSDDPDAARISAQAERQIKENFQPLADDISVMSLDPNDQLLNALLSRARIVLQLSTGEGYEVKVSEAQRKGRPVIGTRVGGIPLQVTHNETGVLVEPGDYRDVAGRMMELCMDDGLWNRMSAAAVKKSNSDETTAVGNALMWLKLALEHGDRSD